MTILEGPALSTLGFSFFFSLCRRMLRVNLTRVLSSGQSPCVNTKVSCSCCRYKLGENQGFVFLKELSLGEKDRRICEGWSLVVAIKRLGRYIRFIERLFRKEYRQRRKIREMWRKRNATGQSSWETEKVRSCVGQYEMGLAKLARCLFRRKSFLRKGSENLHGWFCDRSGVEHIPKT